MTALEQTRQRYDGDIAAMNADLTSCVHAGGYAHLSNATVLFALPADRIGDTVGIEPAPPWNDEKTLVVYWAAGCISSLIALVRASAPGYERLCWQRSFKGRTSWHTYTLHRILKHA